MADVLSFRRFWVMSKLIPIWLFQKSGIVSPAYGFSALALVKCSNEGGPGPRHNMKEDPGVNGRTYFVVNMFAYSRKVSKIERLKGQFPEILKNERDENKRSDSHGR